VARVPIFLAVLKFLAWPRLLKCVAVLHGGLIEKFKFSAF
jgi:hypothetical protein